MDNWVQIQLELNFTTPVPVVYLTMLNLCGLPQDSVNRGNHSLLGIQQWVQRLGKDCTMEKTISNAQSAGLNWEGDSIMDYFTLLRCL